MTRQIRSWEHFLFPSAGCVFVRSIKSDIETTYETSYSEMVMEASDKREHKNFREA